MVHALQWIRRAADQRDASAQTNLGVLYDEGRGVPQDLAEAVRWSRRAALQGHASAQFNFGLRLAIGQGVPVDLVEAHKRISLAAARYSAEESAERVTAAKALAKLAPSMTPAQIAAARRRAHEWTRKPEPQGNRK